MKPPAPVVKPKLDVSTSVSTYKSDPDWMFKSGIGGMITAATLLISLLDIQHLVFVPVGLALSGLSTGFVLRTMRDYSAKPRAKLPLWADWMDMFMFGITWIAIQFGLIMIAMMIITALLVITVYGMNQSGKTLLFAEVGAFSIFFILLFLHFAMTFLMVNYATEQKLGAGFNIGEVLKRASANPGLFYLAWALSTALPIVAVIVPSLTLIGVFIVPSTYFASLLVGAHFVSQAWSWTPERAAELASGSPRKSKRKKQKS